VQGCRGGRGGGLFQRCEDVRIAKMLKGCHRLPSSLGCQEFRDVRGCGCVPIWPCVVADRNCQGCQRFIEFPVLLGCQDCQRWPRLPRTPDRIRSSPSQECRNCAESEMGWVKLDQ
jgi:hypothetical protein